MSKEESLRRWRLVFGKQSENDQEQEESRQAAQGSGQGQGEGDGQSQAGGPSQPGGLSSEDRKMDETLETLYNGDPLNEDPANKYNRGRRGGYGSSTPDISRFLGDIRSYFPSEVVEVVQQDVINNFGLDALLKDPELASTIEPSMELVTTIMNLRDALPEESRETARIVVEALVQELMQKLEYAFEQAFRRGKIDFENRDPRPRLKDLHLFRTILANLQNYDESYETLTELRKLIAPARSSNSAQDLILVIDRSGSMAESIVYTSIYTALLSMIPSIRTRVIVFDTEIVDLTDLIDDPLEFLFAIKLGGGTDIERALNYAQDMVTRPNETSIVLISDLYEGGATRRLLDRVRSILEDQVNLICVTALTDDGRGAYDQEVATAFANLGAPSFACTPDVFPEIMSRCLNRKSIDHLISKKGKK